MLHDCLWEIQYPCGSVCLGKYPGRALLQLAFEDGTLWTPDVGNSACYQPEQPSGAVQCIFWSGFSSLGGQLLTADSPV